jgi:hypothetical protein
VQCRRLIQAHLVITQTWYLGQLTSIEGGCGVLCFETQQAVCVAGILKQVSGYK